MHTKLSTRAIASLDTADFSDCINTGYRWTLYSDGHLAAERVSRWQGSRSGTRYVTDAGYVDLSEIGPHNPESDADVHLSEAIRDLDPANDRDFRCTRNGYVVR